MLTADNNVIVRGEHLAAQPHPFADLTPHYYGVIAADPAWRFRTWSKKGEGRSPQKHYPTMTLAEMMEMPVGMLAAPDCWLLVWVPGQHLEQVFALIRAWGFTYSGIGFVWAKTKKRAPQLFFDRDSFAFGLGKTTRKGTEICLLARRGHPARKSAKVRELIVAPLREHSRKPDEFYDRVREFAAGPYLELFACQVRPGWDAWGNETDKYEPLR